jgi:hypothetical protein
MGKSGQPKINEQPVKKTKPGRDTTRKKSDKKSVRIHLTPMEAALLGTASKMLGGRPSEVAKHALMLYLEAYGRNLKEQVKEESQDGESEERSLPDGEEGTTEESGYIPEQEVDSDRPVEQVDGVRDS